jgi:hypothetical protein
LPSSRPELNPNEDLSADLKQAVARKPPVRSKHELKRTVVSPIRRLTKMPERVPSYFTGATLFNLADPISRSTWRLEQTTDKVTPPPGTTLRFTGSAGSRFPWR